MSRVDEQVQAVMDDWMKNQVYPTVRKNACNLADKLVEEAISTRLNIKSAHNYTGNLLNSIVAGVYEDNKPVYAAYSYKNHLVHGAITTKMSAPRLYFFLRDYDGEESRYKPTIKTDKGFGRVDAERFFNSYRPGGTAKFSIVLAYTTEYAGFVETMKQNIGLNLVWRYAEQKAGEVLKYGGHIVQAEYGF